MRAFRYGARISDFYGRLDFHMADSVFGFLLYLLKLHDKAGSVKVTNTT